MPEKNKGFFKKFMDKIDKKIQQKAEKSCCCSGKCESKKKK